MPNWLKILLYIILILAILAGLGIGGYEVYKVMNKKGTCSYTPFSIPNSDTPPTQVGYISCSGGGGFWKANSVSVINNGPGTFFVGPIKGYTTPVELDVGETINTDLSSVALNVYSEGVTTSPNLGISW